MGGLSKAGSQYLLFCALPSLRSFVMLFLQQGLPMHTVTKVHKCLKIDLLCSKVLGSLCLVRCEGTNILIDA